MSIKTIDFETFGIEGRPHYPPMPVGFSIKHGKRVSKYYAFGHLTGNNCSWEEAYQVLKSAYESGEPLLFQNAKFDLDVAEEWFGLKLPEWQRVHDTMFLLFLDDPHQLELSLKPAAQRLLGWDPEEQEGMYVWLVKNQPIPGVKISISQKSPHFAGRYIAFAPADIVGEYANGDVDRTKGIFDLLYDKTLQRGMGESYDRERRLMPILLEMERQGIQIDVDRLESDFKMYSDWHDKLDQWVYKELSCHKNTNLNSGQQLFYAMLKAGFIDTDKALLTPTGKYQTNKEALLKAVTNKPLLAVLKYRSQLSTCLNTFMGPWLATAKKSGGKIFTYWNQVKSPKSGDSVGTRTGRLSSTPNFQNMPNTFGAIFRHQAKDRKSGRSLPKCPFKDLPNLPLVRSYIIPFDGEVFIDRDYSQQEPRILGHFDGAEILEKYLENPWIDFHDAAQAALAERGKIYDRKPVKNTNLGTIYGMGVGKLAERNGMSVEESKNLKNAIMELYPGLKDMYKDMKVRAKMGEPIRTWGGREYYCEPPKIVKGRTMHFDYKMVNVLIQGSAADCTKEAIIRYHAAKHPKSRIILNVHDQITVSVKPRLMAKEMEKLRKAMESIEFDVPMLTEGSVSDIHWGALKDYDKKGELVWEK